MSDKPTYPEGGDEGKPTSSRTNNPEGTFKPGNVRKPGSEISRSITDNPSRKINQGTLEQYERRGEVLGIIKTLLEQAGRIKIDAKDQLLKNLITVEEEVKELRKQISDEGLLVDEAVFTFLKESEEDFGKLETDIKAEKDRERRENFTSLLGSARDYDKFISFNNEVISKIKDADSSVITEKDGILFEIADLSWLDDTNEVTKRLDEGTVDAMDVRVRLNALLLKINSAEDAIKKIEDIEAEKRATLETTKREGEILKGTLQSLQTESRQLRVLDTSLTSERDRLDTNLKKAIKAFDAKPGDTTLEALDKMFAEYSELLERMKASVVTTITPPAFLSATITKSGPEPKEANDTPQEIPRNEGATEVTNNENTAGAAPAMPSPDTHTQPTPDVVDESTEIPGLQGNWQVGYTVNLKGKDILIENVKVPGTLLRFNDILKKGQNKNIDFTKANELKEVIMQSLSKGNFREATDSARALGDELNIIVREHLTVPEIIIGTTKRFIETQKDPANSDADFTIASSLNDSVLQAIDAGDIALADTNARALGKELNRIVEEVQTKKLTQDDTAKQNNDASTAVIPPAVAQDPTPTPVTSTPPNPATAPQAPSAKRSGDKVIITVGNEDIEVPKTISALVNRFRQLFNNPKYRGVDFAQAISERETLFRFIKEGNMVEAEKASTVLSSTLDTIESAKSQKSEPGITQSDATTTTSQVKSTPNVTADPEPSPEAPRIKAHVVDPPNITFDVPTKTWKIKRGDTFERMSAQEYELWMPIKMVLSSYRNFMDSKDIASAFPWVIAIKNDILIALSANDFKLASSKSKELLRELDPASKHSAAQIRNEVRQSNLKKLQTQESYELQDTTTTFAFIRTPQESTIREFRIISRDTGDWVPLNDKDIACLDLVTNVLTNFKMRASSPREVIEKKNQVLNLINDYDFKDAEKAAKEYLDLYADTNKIIPETQVVTPTQVTTNSPSQAPNPPTATLHPPVAVTTQPQPVSSMEKKIEDQTSLLAETNQLLGNVTRYIKSDLEKTAFKRLSDELAKLESELLANPTKQALLVFSAKIQRFRSELAKKEKFIKAQLGEDVFTSTSTIPAGAEVRLNKRLRGDIPLEDATETIEQWEARQALKANDRDLELSQKKKAEDELYEKHKEIFKKNPELYQQIHHEKNNVRDKLTEDISRTVARDVLIELTNKRHEVLGRKTKLQEDVMNKVFRGNFDEAMRPIAEELAALDAEIRKYTTINLSKATQAPINTSVISAKQVYSPAQDASLLDSSRGIGRNYTLNENYEPVKIDRELLSEGQIKEMYPQEEPEKKLDQTDESEKKPSQPGYIPLAEKAQLSGSLYPNHTEGMMSSLNAKEASYTPDAYKDSKETVSYAKETEQLLAEAKQEAAQEQVVAQENTQERHKLVNKLAEVLSRFTSVKRYPWGWLAAGLASLAIGTSAGVTVGGALDSQKEARTLADLIKNQPDWRTLIPESVESAFVMDFKGPKEKNFEEFMKNNMPSFNIGPTNPSAKDKVANLLCKNVYDIEGANAGLNETQQHECAKMIRDLQEIMKAVKAQSGTLYGKDVRLFGDLTVMEFYEQVRKVVAAADAEKDRLAKS